MRYIKSLLILITALFPLFSTAKEFKIIGKCIGLTADSIEFSIPGGRISGYARLIQTINRKPVSREVYKTSVRNGSFVITGDIACPTEMLLSCGTFQTLWIEPGVQQVTVEADKIAVEGSVSHDNYLAYMVALDQTESSNRPEFYKKYVADHPSSCISLYPLFFLVGNESLPLEENEALFQGLDEQVRNCVKGQEIKYMLDKQSKTATGQPAPNFSAWDLSPRYANRDKPRLTLDSFKGKVVLLDFWAWWCGPCRKGIPYWKTMYADYHDAGFELLFINHDFRSDSVSYRQAITEEDIGIFHHVNCVNSWDFGHIDSLDIVENYYVQAIPRYVVIDRKGVIRGTWVGGSEQNFEEMKSVILHALHEQ